MDNTKLWIWFQLVFGAANPKAWGVLNQFDTLEEAYATVKSGKFRNISGVEAKRAVSVKIEEAEKVISDCDEKGYRIICYDDNDYPSILKTIYNAPLVLYCMGNPGVLNDEVGITVVGTRNPSPYGVKVAERICKELSKVGFVLISGFALGIDSMAHKSALLNRGRTVAVLGCGLDVDYPKQNAKTKKIIAMNGAVISEYIPGTRPDRVNFPKRNRILSGLGIGTLVVEAAMGSGSLITAECAIEQGRDVFCVPPADVFDNRYAGVIKYLREGAIPAFSHLDIIYEYYTGFSHKISTANLAPDYYHENVTDSVIFQSVLPQEHKKNKKTDVKKSEDVRHDASEDRKEETTEEKEYDFSGLEEGHKLIVKAMEQGFTYADELSSETGISISTLFSMLTDLEISGIVRALPGKAYKLI